jgi:hypothetical protein
MHLVHTLANPAVNEICGVFPISGRSSVAVMVSFGMLNPVGITATFRISGITPKTNTGGGEPRDDPREILLWPAAPAGVINLTGTTDGLARAVLQQPKCDFLMVTAQISNVGCPLVMDITAED